LAAVWVPTAAHEALRDLVRARESAKRDERRARQRLLKFLLRRGVSTPPKMRLWTEKHRAWVWSLTFELAPQQATLEDYATEVDHARDRVQRLERAIDAAIETAPGSLRAVIDALQAMRGVSQLAAVTIVAEVGELCRAERASRRPTTCAAPAKPREVACATSTARDGTSGPQMRVERRTVRPEFQPFLQTNHVAWRLLIASRHAYSLEGVRRYFCRLDPRVWGPRRRQHRTERV
jgi:hypothetical protein